MAVDDGLGLVACRARGCGSRTLLQVAAKTWMDGFCPLHGMSALERRELRESLQRAAKMGAELDRLREGE